VHEKSFGSNGIEGSVGEAEILDVANLEIYRKASTSSAAHGLADQGFAEVYTGNQAAGSDQGGEIKAICAHSAANIQHLHPRLKAKSAQDRRLPRHSSGLFVSLVEEMKEEGGIAGTVDRGEMRYILAWHNYRV